MTIRLNLETEIGETWLFSFPYQGAQSVSAAIFRIATRRGAAKADIALGGGLTLRDQAVDVKITPAMQSDYTLKSDIYTYELRVTLANSLVDTIYSGSFYLDGSLFNLPDPLPPGEGWALDFSNSEMSGLIVILEDI